MRNLQTMRPMLAAIFLIALLQSSCNKQEHGTGVGLFSENNELGAHFTDTMRIISYSKMEDSVLSSNTGVLNLGFYNDPFFGNTKAEIYSQFEIGGSGVDFGDTLSCDSIVLFFKLGSSDRLYYGHENGPLRMDVNLISRNSDFNKDSSYYSNSTLAINRESLLDPDFNNLIEANFVDTVYLSRDSSFNLLQVPGVIRLKLKNSFGQKFLDLNGSSVLSSNDLFLEEFKGLHVSISDEMGESILFIDMEDFATTMMLYYKKGSDQELAEYKFIMDEESAHFNSYTHDYLQSGSLRLKAALLDSSIGNEYISLQSAGGFKAYVEFPDLLELLNTHSDSLFVPLNKVELILPIEEGSTKSFEPPNQLFIFMINEDGKEELVLDQYLGTGHIDGVYDRDKNRYRFNLIKQFQAILNGDINLNRFVIKTSNPGSTPNRVIINGNAADTSLGIEPMKLRVYYSSLIN